VDVEFVTHQADKRIVLLAGLARPDNVVKKQILSVRGSQTAHFKARSVNDNLSQLSNF
jgi:hypothetical protein